MRGRLHGMSAATMKKPSNAVSQGSDQLRPEYRFDYSRARPNPYAARLKGKAVAVVLDAEVVQRRSKGKPRATRRSNNQLQRRPAQSKKPPR